MCIRDRYQRRVHGDNFIKQNLQYHMQIFIKTLTQKKHSMNFEPENTINQIKLALQEKEGIMADQIKLVSSGKLLEDNKKISDYNLEAGATIHMVINLQGGF
eukprot:TRINITY_DN1319_c0_g1_i4.p1 TRINITY_DN1319_c0_g1~~TRINITY_DN1319_c0_g1_i4.p1  ORF type:complete len:102 (+),score=29.30 TRINITY_DN1319_c0_g1_i4:3-308(+)